VYGLVSGFAISFQKQNRIYPDVLFGDWDQGWNDGFCVRFLQSAAIQKEIPPKEIPLNNYL
jgi:hypothetical protein